MCGASSCCKLARGLVIGDSPLSLLTALLSLSASYWTWTSTSSVVQSVELLSDHTAHVAAHVVDQCPLPAPCPAPVCAACGRCEPCTIVKAGWPDLTGFYLGVVAGVLLTTFVCAIPCLVRFCASAVRDHWTKQYHRSPAQRPKLTVVDQPALENADFSSSPTKVWTPKSLS